MYLKNQRERGGRKRGRDKGGRERDRERTFAGYGVSSNVINFQRVILEKNFFQLDAAPLVNIYVLLGSPCKITSYTKFSRYPLSLT